MNDQNIVFGCPKLVDSWCTQAKLLHARLAADIIMDADAAAVLARLAVRVSRSVTFPSPQTRVDGERCLRP